MKIGILTLPFNNNYGGYLQSIALYQSLVDYGHDVEVINRRRNKISIVEQFRFFCGGLRRRIFGSSKQPLFIETERIFKKRGKNMLPLVFNCIKLTKPIYSSDQLHRWCADRYDIIIVGSDQVWRPDNVPNIEDYFFSGFEDKVKKIVYAASFGNSDPKFTDVELNHIRSIAPKINAVYLREESGLKVVEALGLNFMAPPKVVLDPTMLLPAEFYINLFERRCTSNDRNNYIFSYILDYSKEVRESIVYINNMIKLPVIEALDSNKWKNFNYIMPPIESWLSNIYYSKIVITDSFHGTVFSIIFNKPFIVFANKTRGIDRFETLLKHFDLLDRIAVDKESCGSVLFKTIDWNRVNQRLANNRDESLSKLFDAISNH